MADLSLLIARKVNLPLPGVEATVSLLERDSTVPFIARYRKAQTGGLDENQIRDIVKAKAYFEELNKRKEFVLKTIEEQGKLTPELEKKIAETLDENVLEDLYLPYKKKRKTKATVAREQGLAPLAEKMMQLTTGDPDAIAREFIQGEICTPKEAISGAQYIIAEEIAEDAELRNYIRKDMQRHAFVNTKKRKTKHPEADKFELYEDFSVEITRIKPHQILALNRGESLGILSVKLEDDTEEFIYQVEKRRKVSEQLIFYPQYREAIKLSLERYLLPAIERELRNMLSEKADQHAIQVFAENLRNLLMQPPLEGRTIMGIDPGFASGCKLVVLDPAGKPLEATVIYPTPPRKRIDQAEHTCMDLLYKYDVDLIAIGNGTACRETEQFVAELIQRNNLQARYLIVSEAGASVYSTSEVAAEEFPDRDPTERGTISIGRRVLDPLSELIKIDPKSMGVGLYQHDVDQKELARELGAVVESTVNEVGVDVNSASAQLLAFVSGLSSRLARNIVKHREQHGPFTRREQLLEVSGIGEKIYEQAAGFLRIRNGEEPLDNTAIHPEAYDALRELARQVKAKLEDLPRLAKKLRSLENGKQEKLLKKVQLDEPTFELIQENLKKPGLDPREDVPAPILRSDVLKMEDLKERMRLKGTVRNVVDFGAFVDIGLKNDALLHVSKMGKHRRVENPFDEVSVGDVLDVEIEKVDVDRGRVSLMLNKKR